LAIVLDLPGEESVKLGLGLAMRGFRPVPVIDGSPGPDILGTAQPNLQINTELTAQRQIAVDMRQTMRWLCIGASILPTLTIAADARPVFLLDDLRDGSASRSGAERFDNRWKTFPEDFPSSRLLKEHGINSVLLVQKTIRQPSEDLAHVLRRWQEDGIGIHAATAQNIAANRPLTVQRPSRFRALWYRALAILGLARGTHGGFGAWPHGTGGG
jgi:hypothetical protein